MKKFDDIFKIAAKRHGGPAALEKKLSKPKSKRAIKAIPDDRWLAQMTRGVFQAGFNWKVVEAMWPGFEEAFHGFDVGRCSMLHGEDFDRLAQDKRIIRYPAKIESVQRNAVFIRKLAEEHGSAGAFFAASKPEGYIGLLAMLKKRATRLGGTTGQYFLRVQGVDSFMLSKDVVARLVAEEVIDKAPTSQKAMQAVQDAFNIWRDQSGRSLTEISRVLAMSV